MPANHTPALMVSPIIRLGRYSRGHSTRSQRLPLIAVLLGVAGLIPFVGCGLAALGPDDAQARTAMLALTGYGAVILAFLGGVHWGFALAPSTAEQSARALSRRLLLGVVPSLIGMKFHCPGMYV